nr:hypothetical protein [Xanthomonadales bacterium]
MKRKALKGMGLSGLAGAGGAGGAYGIDFADGLIIAPLLGGAGAFMVYSYYRNDWAESLSADVMPVICRFLGGMDYGGPGFELEPFARLGLLPSFTRSELEDVVTGHHDGFDFALCEVRLARRTRSSRGRTKRKTVFKGLLIRIELLEEVPAIYFARERGAIGNWLSEKFSSHQDEGLRLQTPY